MENIGNICILWEIFKKKCVFCGIYIYIYEMYVIQFMWDMNVKYCEQLMESSWFHSELITSWYGYKMIQVIYPLVICYVANWKPWPIEIVDLPIYNMVIFHSYVKVYQSVIWSMEININYGDWYQLWLLISHIHVIPIWWLVSHMVIIRMYMDVAHIRWDIHATNNGMWYIVYSDSYHRYGLIQNNQLCVEV